MDTLHAFIIIVACGLIHASFQLSISVLTLLSGHAIGARASHARVLRLSGSFVAGVAVATTLITSTSALVLLSLFGSSTVPLLAWTTACGLMIGLGVSIWSFYYRRETGTSLWLPRSIAGYLTQRSKATKHSGEAFGLGLTSVFSELLFIIVPTIVASLTLIQLSPTLQLTGVLTYTAISLSSLFIVASLIGAGHKLSTIQKWRETNKSFLQFVGGAGLLILGFYIYVENVTAAFAYSGGIY